MVGILSIATTVVGLAVLLQWVLRPILVVQQGRAVVLQLMGRFARVLEPGWHVVLPILARPLRIPWRLGARRTQARPVPVGWAATTRAWCCAAAEDDDEYSVSLGDTVLEMEPLVCRTADGRQATVAVSLQCRVVDVAVAAYVEALDLLLQEEMALVVEQTVAALDSGELDARVEKQARSRLGHDDWLRSYGVKPGKLRVHSIALTSHASDGEPAAPQRGVESALEFAQEEKRLDWEEKLNARAHTIAEQALAHELRLRKARAEQQLAEETQRLHALQATGLSDAVLVAWLYGANWTRMMESNCQKLVVPAHFTGFFGDGAAGDVKCQS